MKYHAAFFSRQETQNLTSANSTFSKEVFANLNIVRALSGLVVVFAHFFQLYVMPVAGRSLPINIAIASAEYAVFAFFLLSGFLIALSIERNIQDHGYFDWRKYLKSRVARIYPALIASVFLCLLLYGLLNLLGMGGAGSLVRTSDVYPPSRMEFSLTQAEVFFTLMQTYAFGPGGYISANGPLWTLSYEVGFYLVAGLLVTLLRGVGLSRIFSVALLVLVAIVAIKMGKYLFLHYGTIWMLGVCLFLGIKKYGAYESKANIQKASLLKPTSLWVIVPGFGFLSFANILLASVGLDGAFIHNWLSSILIVVILFGITRFRRKIFRRFAKMADSTYTLYLFHFPLMLFFYAVIRDVHDMSPLLYYVVALMFTLFMVPINHYLAVFLEDRRLWESFWDKLRLQAVSCLNL